ncbi:ABC transporter permease [Streptomyces sp. SCSIO ZS0520]|uniref:ABC transporter permease n=1 Tax=Streptomyces sp. SCSIO ZS0520 TaxID=2892996 RepID=UPI0021D81DCA|nr:ABC transporter permease [Streptomyces sp. SCSIO ZS0520]
MSAGAAKPLTSRPLARLRLPSRLAGARARTALAVVALLVLTGALAPLLAPHDPVAQSDDILAGPGAAHPLGTDDLGRDVFSRVLYGLRVDLVVGVLGVSGAGAIGVLLALAALRSAAVDAVLQRVLDVLLAFPSLILAVAVAAVLGTGQGSITAAVVISQSALCARVVRDAMLAHRRREYILAAELAGVRPGRLLVRHLLPTAFDPLTVQLALSLSTAVFLEGGMSFVGIGVLPPDPSLGNVLQESVQYLGSEPLFAAGPLLVIVALVLCFNTLADALNRSHR